MDDIRKAALFFPIQKVLPHLEDRHLRRLCRDAPEIDWRPCLREEDFLRELPDCQAAVIWRFEKEWLASAGKLRLIATPAAGREWIRVGAGAGLTLWFGTFHGELMAETAIGMMLAFARGIKLGLELQKDEPWARARLASSMRALRGGRAVILGFGHIGKWIGRLLKPFGLRLTGVNRTDMTRPGYMDAEDRVIPVEGLDRALAECDHLILALPGSAGAEGIIGAERLALLPPGAHVYNLGRGNAIDMPALAMALRSGRLAGAGLDVYDREPLPADHPLRGCPNTILLPHVSAFAPNYLDLYLDELLPAIRLFPSGKPEAL